MIFYTFVDSIYRSIEAFRQRKFEQAIQYQIFGFENFKTYRIQRLNKTGFNTLYDASEILLLVVEQSVCLEQSEFITHTTQRIQQSLDEFTVQLGGSYTLLDEAIQTYIQLLKYLGIAIYYLQKVGIQLADKNAAVSLKIDLEHISLYYLVDQAALSERQKKAYVKLFEDCFQQEHDSTVTKNFWDKVANLEKQKKYTECLQLLEDQIDVVNNSNIPKKKIYYKMGDVLFNQHLYNEALDMYMKGYILGGSKEDIKEKVKRSCTQLMLHTNDSKERLKWQKLQWRFK